MKILRWSLNFHGEKNILYHTQMFFITRRNILNSKRRFKNLMILWVYVSLRNLSIENVTRLLQLKDWECIINVIVDFSSGKTILKKRFQNQDNHLRLLPLNYLPL